MDVGDEHFQQGAFRLYSRDVIEYIVRNRKSYNHSAPEDVAMGRGFSKLGIELVPLPSYNFTDIEGVESLTTEDFLNNYHFRMKSGSFKKRQDVSIMHSLHDRIQNEFQ